MKTDLVLKAKRGANKVGFVLKKHSPEILMGLGIAGTVAGTIAACKATTKLDDILAEHRGNATKIREFSPDDIDEDIEYTEEDRKKDLVITYTKTGLKVVKLYAPAMIIMGLSLSSILASVNIMKKRNLALATAYTALNKTFSDYRERVSAKYGPAAEQEMRYGLEKKKISEETVDENGKKKTVKKDIMVSTLNEDTSIEFSEKTSSHWDSVMDYNWMFIQARQQLANDMLMGQGYLTLNEVLDLLDIDRTVEGFQLGWIFDPKNENGDNCVDFRAVETTKVVVDEEGNERYIPIIRLDPNYDGPILNDTIFKKAVKNNQRK